MKKTLTEKVVYEPNKKVKLTVSNIPVYDDDGLLIGYDPKVSISVKVGDTKEKLSFADTDELQKFIEDIDVEEPQQSLL